MQAPAAQTNKPAGSRLASWLGLALVVLVFCMAYLPFINQLGYYKDDWHMIFAGDSYGSQKIVEEFSIDRPFMGVLNAWTYDLLGDAPLAWNLLAFGARLAGVLGLYALLRLLWPRQLLAITSMTLLFAVYPGFLQQPNAATFQNHFIGYSAGVISLLLTVLALRAPRLWQKILWTGLALLTMLLCVFIYEYMIGLEGIRVFLIWYWTQREAPLPWKKQIWRVVKLWLPYVAAAGVFVFWRLFIFKSTRYATSTGVLAEKYLSNPLGALVQLGVDTLRDLFEVIVLGWFVPLYQLTVNATPGPWLASLALGLAAATALIGYAVWLKRRGWLAQEEETRAWAWPAVIIGFLGVVVTMLPVLAADRSVYYNNQFDRYTLQATVGVALLIGGGAALTLRPRARTILWSALLVLALMTHFNNIQYWKQFWTIQQQFWWQVSWRAPQIEADTVLMAYLPSGYRLAEDYEIFSPANLIYYPGVANTTLVAEVLNPETADMVAAGDVSDRSIRTFNFTRNFSQALIMSWSGTGSCVHVQDAQRLEISSADDLVVARAAPYSQAERIEAGEDSPSLPQQIFGAEPVHGWCYHYQKASLARQNGDWAELSALTDSVLQQNLAPQYLVEWLPFLESLVHDGKIDQAEEIVQNSNADERQRQLICAPYLDDNGAGIAVVSPEMAAFVRSNICQTPAE
jgi:hypothetical protein